MRFKKSWIFICLVIFLFSIASVVASDVNETAVASENQIDEVINVENQDVNDVDVETIDEIDDGIETDDNGILTSADDTEDLSYNLDDDVLQASPPYNKYSVSVSDTTLTYGKSGSVQISVTSVSGYDYRYDFYFRVYDSNNNQKISKNYYSSTSTTKITHTIGATELNPGIYTIKIVNYADNYVMDTATLTVKSVPYTAYSVRVSSTSLKYNVGGTISMSITPASSSYYYRYDFYLKVYDSSNKEKISQRYYSTSSSTQASYNVGSTALSQGTYTIKILNNVDNHVMATATLTVIYLPYTAYSVSVSDTNIYYQQEGSIVMSISPAFSNDYKYDFYLKVYDSSNKVKISQRYYSTSSSTQVSYSVASAKLPLGTYTIKIINNYDNQIMDTATLNVKSIYNIESKDVTGWCDNVIQYRVRVSEKGQYKSGLSVSFTCNNKQYSAQTDNEGYATLKIHLKAGTYTISTKYEDVVKNNKIVINKRYVGNKYRNVKISSFPTVYYGEDKKINYGFEGNMKGCIKIYKGKSLKYSKSWDTNGYISDYFKYNKHSYSYSVKNLKGVGTYTVKIIGSNGKVLFQSKFKIKKSPTKIKGYSFKTIGGFKDYVWGFLISKYGPYQDIGGKAKFKIGGKIYKAKVKRGDTKVKVKFPSKKKTYRCKVKFLGDKNHKASSAKFKIKTTKIKNPIKVGKYRIKLNSKQYKSISKAVHNGKYKSKVIKTKYWQKFKKPYIKKIKRYKTTKSVYTWQGLSYLPTMNKMWSNGWTKVSERINRVPNPKNKYGIGLSAYDIATTKWVKISYKLAYKTKYYPVKAKIKTSSTPMEKPKIKIFSHGYTLRNGKVAFA